jgi:inorganic pyrophosphatase
LQTGIRSEASRIHARKAAIGLAEISLRLGGHPFNSGRRRRSPDVLVIHDAATYPDLILRCKPIGVLEVLQITKGEKERNDRVFAVPDRSAFEGDLQDVRRLPARAVEELEKLFEATDALGDKKLEFLGWRGPTHAVKTIKRLSR